MIKRTNVNRRASWQHRDTAKECSECIAMHAKRCGREPCPFALFVLCDVNHGLAFRGYGHVCGVPDCELGGACGTDFVNLACGRINGRARLNVNRALKRHVFGGVNWEVFG